MLNHRVLAVMLAIGMIFAFGVFADAKKPTTTKAEEAPKVTEDNSQKPNVVPVGSLIVTPEVLVEAVRRNNKIDLGPVSTRGGTTIVQRGADASLTLAGVGAVVMENYSKGAVDALAIHTAKQLLVRFAEREKYYANRGSLDLNEDERVALYAEYSSDLKAIYKQINQPYEKMASIVSQTVNASLGHVTTSVTPSDVARLRLIVRQGFETHREKLTEHAKQLEGLRKEIMPRKDAVAQVDEDDKKDESDRHVANKGILDTMPVAPVLTEMTPTAALNAQMQYERMLTAWQKAQRGLSLNTAAQAQSERIAYLERKLQERDAADVDSAGDHTDHVDAADVDDVGNEVVPVTAGMSETEVRTLMDAQEERLVSLVQEMVEVFGKDIRKEMTDLNNATRTYFAGELDRVEGKVDGVQISIDDLGVWLRENVGYTPPENSTSSEDSTSETSEGEEEGNGFFGSMWFWVLVLILIAALILVIVARKRGSDPTTLNPDRVS